MPNPSHLYAEKVFAEHPISLWTFDERADYVNFVEEDFRDFSDSSKWSIFGGTAEPDFEIFRPFENSHCTKIKSSGLFNLDITSEKITSFYLDPRLKTFSVAFYAYFDTENVQGFSLSAFVSDPEGEYYNNDVKLEKDFLVERYNRWNFYSHSFEVAEEIFVKLEDLVASSFEPTSFFIDNHGFSENDVIILSSSGSLPKPLQREQYYYVLPIDGDSFVLSSTPSGQGIFVNDLGDGDTFLTPVNSLKLGMSFVLTDDSEATFFLNGLSVGQWAEDFQERSLGISFDSEKRMGLGIDQSYFEESSYGLQDSPIRYMIRQSRLLASNKNIPMVFGSRNSTSVYPNLFGKPSVIFEGFGFLNESGRYRTYTAEFWLRVNESIRFPKKIFGPVGSSDGLYLDGPFLILKVGDRSASHYLGETYRPMLIDFMLFPGGSSLMINGEKVIDLSFDRDNVRLAPKFNSDGEDQDWLGFFSYDDILSFEIDCVALYPYRVASSVAKRRYVYGQAVEFPENISALYGGKSFPVDYTFSRYGNNFVYPDIAQWQRGFSENISLDKKALSPPNYRLPSFVFNNRTEEEWNILSTQKKTNGIMLKPDSSWDNTEGYLFFNNLDLSKNNAKSVYGVFESRVDRKEKEVLFRLEDDVSGNYLESTTEKNIESCLVEEKDSVLVFKKDGHKMIDNDLVKISTNSGKIPITFLEDREYSVNYIDENSFSLSESLITGPISSAKPIESVVPSSPGVIKISDHRLEDNDVIFFVKGDELPFGLFEDLEYFVKVVDKDSFVVSLEPVEPFDQDKLITISSFGEGDNRVQRKLPDDISVSKRIVSYSLFFDGNKETILETPGITFGQTFVAGIDFEKFSNFFGGRVSSLLRNRNRLKVFFGGSKDLSNTFSGYIYRAGFSTKRNLGKLKYFFDSRGVPFLRYQFDANGVNVPEGTEIVDSGYLYEDYIEDILSHKASYTLFLKSDVGTLSLDIATDSYWEDNIPLSFFAKNVTKRGRVNQYGLDFLQFNIDYPSPEEYIDECCDTSSSVVKTYISFQYADLVENKLSSSFSQKKPAPKNGVVSPGDEWVSTQYEVVNGSVIYLPPKVDFSRLAVVVHVEMSVDGIFSRPVKIKNLEISGRSLNEDLANKIFSRLGSSASPYTKYGVYFDYDDKNPFSIYKDSTPYLYLNKHSGLKVVGKFDDPRKNRGILFPINEERSEVFSLAAVQLSMRFDNPEFLDKDIPLFKVEGGSRKIYIYGQSIHPDGERVLLYALDQFGNSVTDLGFYINGNLSSRPTIGLRDWNMLGLAFSNPLSLGNTSGSFKLTGPILVNNFSYYGLTPLQESQFLLRSESSAFFDQDDYFGVSPTELFDIYCGTNKLISGDSVVLAPKTYQYSTYQDLNLQIQTYKAL